MIQINKLYSLDDIKDYYYITDDYKILNLETGAEIKIWISVRGYPCVSLQRKESYRTGRNIPVHKIVALAFINNSPYTLIEHIDDNKLDYRPNNLKFSNKSENGKSAFRNGLRYGVCKVYKVNFTDSSVMVGKASTIAKVMNIPKGFLYWRASKARKPGDTTYVNGKHNINSITYIGQQTIELGSGA